VLFAQCNNKECNGCVPIELTNHFPLSGLRCRVRTVYAHGCVPIELTNHLLRRSAFVQLSGSSILHSMHAKIEQNKTGDIATPLARGGIIPARARHAGCMHEENLRNPVRVGRVGFMRWLPIGQVYSTTTFCILMQPSRSMHTKDESIQIYQ